MILLMLLLLFCGTARAEWETYAIEHPDGSVTVQGLESSIEDINSVIEKNNYSVSSVTQISSKDVPTNKADRTYWKKQGKKIVVDTDKKKENEDAKADKEAERASVFLKLGITKEEFEKL